MDVNWLYVSLAAGLVYLAVLGVFVAQRRWSWAALGVAAANFFWVLPNLAAPFRGALDPGYAGYRAGVYVIEPGILVSLVAGGIVAGALISACLALRNRAGPAMAFIALYGCTMLLTVGLPELLSGLQAPQDYAIHLGAYLKIPGLIALVLIGGLLCLPLIASIVWSARRIAPRPSYPSEQIA